MQSATTASYSPTVYPSIPASNESHKWDKIYVYNRNIQDSLNSLFISLNSLYH